MAEQMSLWELISNASLPVQLVMLLLFVASVVSWFMIVQRGIFLRGASKKFIHFENVFWSGADLNELFNDGRDRNTEGAENVFRAGFREFNRLVKQGSTDPDAIMEGTERAMRVALSREEDKLNANLPFLASVASTSPYVGLFGTVWGIMQSFRGLANVQQATLAVVAPGIAEALIATAMGLFAAIPAVLAFNRYSTRSEALFTNYHTFAEEFSSILHRRVHNR